MAKSDNEAWRRLGDVICELLSNIYRDKPDWSRRAARKEGITVESLAAAAICGMLSKDYGVRLQSASPENMAEAIQQGWKEFKAGAPPIPADQHDRLFEVWKHGFGTGALFEADAASST